MNLDHLEFGDPVVVDLTLDGGTAIRQRRAADVTYNEEGDVFLLRQDEELALVQGRSPRDIATLRHLCVANLPRIAWVVKLETSGSPGLTLQVHTFPGALEANLDIGIDEKVVEDAGRKYARVRSAVDAMEYLSDQFILRAEGARGATSYAFASAGVEGVESLEDAFVLHGRTLRAHVLRTPHPSGAGEILRIERLMRSNQPVGLPILPVGGTIRFADVTQAALVRADWKSQWDLLSPTKSFLKQWERYGDLEVEDLLERAQEVGALEYVGWDSESYGTRFYIKPGSALNRLRDLRTAGALTKGDELEVVTEPPPISTTPRRS